jgi:tetratricopeptide (TPR) repeat protein
VKTNKIAVAGMALLLALTSGRALAQSDDALARARTHFEAGRALYNLGSYTEAEREFAAAYQLAPRRELLINLGQCYRKLDELDKAQKMYAHFLREAPPDDMHRPAAEQVLHEIEALLAARKPPPPPPPLVRKPVVGPDNAGAPSAANPALLAAPATTVRSGPPRKTWLKRNWWVIPVGTVVVGAALGTGLYFGLRAPGVCTAKDALCVDGSQWH